MKFGKTFIPAAVAITATAALCFSFVDGASAVPPTTTGTGNIQGDNVTICHRTNSLTNPYVEITIDPNGILGPGSSSHGPQNTNHNRGTGVFDPDFNYPNNAKDWQDIIPPFDYTLDGTPQSFAGYNYTGAGLAIYEHGCDGRWQDSTTTTSGGGGSTTTTSGGGGSTTTTTEPLPRNGVRVTVYVDLNNNCQQDADEPTVPEVDVEVAKNSRSYDLTTGSDGTVVEGPLPGGSYNGTVTSDLIDMEVTCTDEDTTDVPGNGIGDIKIGIRGSKDVEIDVTPPPGEEDPEEITVHYCGADEICDNEDDFEFPVKKDSNGKFNVSGLPGGKYYVRPQGYEAIPVEITEDGQSVSLTAVPDTLVVTGTRGIASRSFAMVMMVLAGGSLLVVRRRRTA